MFYTFDTHPLGWLDWAGNECLFTCLRSKLLRELTSSRACTAREGKDLGYGEYLAQIGKLNEYTPPV
jgi:hypothetical protein